MAKASAFSPSEARNILIYNTRNPGKLPNVSYKGENESKNVLSLPMLWLLLSKTQECKDFF